MLVLTTSSLNRIRDRELSVHLFSGGLPNLPENVALDYEEADIATNEFSLQDSKGNLLDDENASSIIYKNLDFASTALSTDERVWATLALSEHFDYSLNRWSRSMPKTALGEDVHGFVQDHFFCPTSRFRYVSHSLARLWWRRRYIDKLLTADKQKAATLFFSPGYSDWGVQLLERPNLAAIPEVANAVVNSSYERFVEGGRSYNRPAFRGMLTKLDVLAGSMVPTLLSYEEVYEAITNSYELGDQGLGEDEID